MARQILTTLVGSYPAPDWLLAHPSEQGLRDATAVVFHAQELAGIDVVTDGELYRFDQNHPETSGLVDYFIRRLRNVRTQYTRTEERKFREMPGMEFRHKPGGVVEGLIGEGTLNIVQDYERSRALTRSKFKFTVTSPYILGKTLVDRHYKSLQEVVQALADVLVSQIREIDPDVLQLDEENLTGSPEDGPWVAEILNVIYDSLGPQTKAAIHLCYGNYGGQSIQKGHWSKLIGFLNSLHIDHVVGEMAYRGYDELDCFKDLRPEIGVGLGVIDVKRTVVETPDEIARRIEQADKILGTGRVTYVHPDCGLWVLRRPIAEAKVAALVKGRDLFLGKGK